jgi:hypothetical protein
MAACYHERATFRDIAFDLRGRDSIAAMWRMICSGDIKATVESIGGDADRTVATVVDVYTFSSTGRPVRNPIESHFRFEDGRIVEHIDHCDARQWASMAFGGVRGFIAGRSRWLRSRAAARKLASHTAPTRHIGS